VSARYENRVTTTATHLRKQGKLRPWSLYAALLVLALASTFVLCFNEIVAAVWHLKNGGTVILGQVEVPVPRSWWAFRPEGGVVVTRVDLFDRDNEADILIGGLRSLSDKPFDADNYADALIKGFSSKNYVLAYSNRVATAASMIRCVHFDAKPAKETVLVYCYSPDLPTYIEFKGSKRYLPVFDTVVCENTPPVRDVY
jgi:hypothetical protein